MLTENFFHTSCIIEIYPNELESNLIKSKACECDLNRIRKYIYIFIIQVYLKTFRGIC